MEVQDRPCRISVLSPLKFAYLPSYFKGLGERGKGEDKERLRIAYTIGDSTIPEISIELNMTSFGLNFGLMNVKVKVTST